jgi:hypothetical protein
VAAEQRVRESEEKNSWSWNSKYSGLIT